MLRSRVVENERLLEELADDWDRLANENSLPYMSSAWLLAWWRHVARPEARLLAIVVEDGDGLAGIAPFWYAAGARGVRRLRLLGTGSSTRRQPLSRREGAADVARAMARELAGVRDRFDLIEFEGVDAASSPVSLAAIAEAWPGTAARVTVERRQPAPILSLEGRTFDEWLASRSSNFRQQMRKSKRDLTRKGATFRMSTEDALERDLDSFARLHHARWQDRGGSYGLNADVERMLLDASKALVGDGRFRLWCTDVDGDTISAHIFLAAGGEMTYWLGGFDEGWSSFRPSLVTILSAVEDAWSRGDRRVDLGVGDQSYKRRFAEQEDELIWPLLVPRGGRYAVTRSSLVVTGLARSVLTRLTPERRAKLKRFLGR